MLWHLRDLLGVPRVIVNLFDYATGEVQWLAAVGRHRIHLGPGVRYSLSLAGDLDALRRGEPQVIDLDAKYHDRIFGIFERLHREEDSGHRRGPRIVRRVAERHRGRAWATSEAGRGSLFFLAIPSAGR